MKKILLVALVLAACTKDEIETPVDNVAPAAVVQEWDCPLPKPSFYDIPAGDSLRFEAKWPENDNKGDTLNYGPVWAFRYQPLPADSFCTVTIYVHESELEGMGDAVKVYRLQNGLWVWTTVNWKNWIEGEIMHRIN